MPTGWERVEVLMPSTWKRWLEDAAEARAMSVAALIRQLIRNLMLTRHDEDEAA